MKQSKQKTGMDAVLEKSEGKRRPAFKRKGPALAIMIAVGKPKPDKAMADKGHGAFSPDEAIKAGKVAELKAKIAALQAELDALTGEETGEDHGEYDEEMD